MKRLWIRIMHENEVQEVKEFISGMPDEYLRGEIPVRVYINANKKYSDLDSNYYVSESALSILKEKYGERNVVINERKENANIQDIEGFNISSLDRIAEALEEISSSLSMVEYYLGSIDRCITPLGNRNDNYGLIITGEVSTR